MQPVARQVRWRDGERLALGGGEQASGAAQVQHLGGAVQDGGQEPGRAGQSSGLAGADPGAVAQDADPEAGEQVGDRDGDHHRGRGAAVPRQPVGVHGLEQGAERLPAALVGGHPPAVRVVHVIGSSHRVRTRAAPVGVR